MPRSGPETGCPTVALKSAVGGRGKCDVALSSPPPALHCLPGPVHGVDWVQLGPAAVCGRPAHCTDPDANLLVLGGLCHPQVRLSRCSRRSNHAKEDQCEAAEKTVHAADLWLGGAILCEIPDPPSGSCSFPHTMVRLKGLTVAFRG